jgi:pimeloyl-ACP methyl ester carboxylesterase
MIEEVSNHKSEVCWREYGNSQGTPVFYFHGMPGSSLEPSLANDFAVRENIRLISPERPGYGGSALKADMALADWPPIILKLANLLNIDRFSIIGFSGGGPYALACAHWLPDRVDRLVLVGSMAPFASEPMQNHINAGFKPLYELSITDFPAALAQVAQLCPSAEGLFGIMESALSDPDKAVFQNTDIAANYRKNLTRAITDGVQGLTHDLRILSSPWGFELEAIRCPVVIWHGCKDNNVGVAIGEYLNASLPVVVDSHFLEGGGHYLLFSHWVEILRATNSDNDTRPLR